MYKQIKNLTFAFLLAPTAIFAQSMPDTKPSNYSIQLQNKSNEVIFETIKTINPKEISLASFNNTVKNSFTSVCLKDGDTVTKGTDYYTEGVRGDIVSTNEDTTLNFSFKKVLDKKEINLGDCNIEEVVIDSASFIVVFPLLEYEQIQKTAFNQYKLIVKRSP